MRKIQKPIRVLHIVGIMNMGGIENLLMNIYRNIDREEIQFDFLVTREEKGIFDDEIKSLGGNIYNIPHMSSVGVLKYKKILFEFFKEHKEFEIVHCHRDALCSIYLKQAKKAKIQVRIAHSHTIKLAEGKGAKGIMNTLIKRYFMLFTRYSATDYFACSKDAGKWLFGQKIANNKLNVIKNGININKYIYSQKIALEIRQKLGVSDNTFLIGHVGRFELAKNHTFLVDIFEQLQKEISNVELCLVGDGSLIEEIKRKVNKLGIQDKVKFLGIQNNINELMMAFDTFLFPSLFEGLGIVAIEAQATGLPCVVSNEIPKEVDLGLGIIHFIDLANCKIWVNKIQDIMISILKRTNSRTSDKKTIVEKGYDIEQTIIWMQRFYLNKITR